jgi:rRNA maturation endonuclease Nob1
MINPNWYDQEPFYDGSQHCDDYYCHTDKGYNIPLIIAEAQRLERGETKFKLIIHSDGQNDPVCGGCNYLLDDDFNFCPHCGANIIWEK